MYPRFRNAPSFAFPTLLLGLAACGTDVDEAIDAHSSNPSAHHDPVELQLPDEVVVQTELDAALTNLEGSLTDSLGDLEASLADEILAVSESIPAPTTDASDLTSGTLDVGLLPPEVALQSDLPLPASRVAGFQQFTFSPTAAVDTTTEVELASVAVDPGPHPSVALVAHLYAERAGATTGRYEFTIREGDCTGTIVGFTLWRPPVSTSSYVADSVGLTGFATVTGPTSFVLCGAKFDSGAPTASVGPRGLIAQW